MMRKGTYENPPKKKKKPKSPKHPERLCFGKFVQKQQGAKLPCFLSYNLPNLGRLGFGRPKEKTLRSHQFSFLPPLPTKYPFQPFSLSLSLSLLPKIISTKHTIKEKQSISTYFPLISSSLSLISLNPTILPRSSQLR